ncbi:MAG: cation diffusion facilitator family transporter [Bauldia sp.]
MDQPARLALGSAIVGLVVLALKLFAYRVTGSVALYSDAIESIINVAAPLVAYVAIKVSARPADADHPFGHQKAEYFSAVIEGVLIVVAALLIFRQAWLGFTGATAPEPDRVGLGANFLATLINAGWAFVLIESGRRHTSPALIADGRHLFVDVVTSIGVLAGVALVFFTGFAVLDPLLAVLVGLYVLWSGWHVMRASVGGLMDEAVAPEMLERIRATIAATAKGALEAHDLRTRHAGRVSFLDFHLVVPGTMSVAEAHTICDEIEAALKADHPGLNVSIHVEPEEKAKATGIPVV